MTSRAFAGTAILVFAVALSGTAAAQETKPDEGASTPKPAEPAAQPPPPQSPPDQGAAAPAPAPPPAEVPPPPPPLPPPYTGPPTDVALTPAEAEPLPGAPRRRRIIFETALGYTSGGAVKHPDLAGTSFGGEVLTLGAGVELNPKWRLVLSFTTFTSTIERVGKSDKFQRVSALHGGAGFQPLAGCDDCGTNGGLGALVVKQPFHVHTLGPRLDYLPFGADSLFVGVTAGAAMMQDLDFRAGVAVAARAGFEWRPYSVLGISVEAGAHGQVYSDASAALPYAALQLNLMAEAPNTSVMYSPAPSSDPPGSTNSPRAPVPPPAYK